MDAGMSRGNILTSVINASTPPADVPITIILRFDTLYLLYYYVAH